MPVVVTFADERHEVASAAALDELLDRLDRGATRLLVALTGDRDVLSIGLGHPAASVVLHRDADGRPWSARSHRGEPPRIDGELSFARGDTTYEFFPRAAVRRSEMRAAARAFLRDPSSRPTTLDWVPEGAGTGDGGAAGDG